MKLEKVVLALFATLAIAAPVHETTTADQSHHSVTKTHGSTPKATHPATSDKKHSDVSRTHDPKTVSKEHHSEATSKSAAHKATDHSPDTKHHKTPTKTASSPKAIKTSPGTPAKPNVLSADYLDACKASSNCEAFTNSQGQQAIRFKAGKGPESTSHSRLMERASSNITTKVSLGGQAVGFGCKGALDSTSVLEPGTFLKKLSSICNSDGTCVTTDSASTKITNYVTPNRGGTSGNGEDATVSLAATGEFPPADLNDFIDAIAAYATKTTNTFSQKIEFEDVGPHGGITVSSTCQNTVASNFYNIARYEGTGSNQALVGFMSATIAVQAQTEDAFCTVINPILAGFGSAIPEVGPAVGAVFGIVSALCAALS